jgi:hypothetical protein
MFKEVELDINYQELIDFVIPLVKEKNPECNIHSSQIAVQSRKETVDLEQQLVESTLSLAYDYNKFDPLTMNKPILIPKEKRLKQEDFVETPDFFKNTPIQNLNSVLGKKYRIMRGRIMNMSHKSALTWHYDESPRLHIPIKIHEGSFMILEDQICRFEIGKTYIINTTKMHTAVNASLDNRIHIVYCLDKLYE